MAAKATMTECRAFQIAKTLLVDTQNNKRIPYLGDKWEDVLKTFAYSKSAEADHDLAQLALFRGIDGSLGEEWSCAAAFRNKHARESFRRALEDTFTNFDRNNICFAVADKARLERSEFCLEKESVKVRIRSFSLSTDQSDEFGCSY